MLHRFFSPTAPPRTLPARRDRCRAEEMTVELAAMPGGYEANLAAIRDAAIMHLETLPQGFPDRFDELSPSIQTKAYRMLLGHPRLSLTDLVDRVEVNLTLGEAAEAEKWLRSLARRAR